MKQKTDFLIGVAFTGSMLAVITGGTAAAQSSPPTAYLQDSTIVGSGNTLTLTRVPVVTSGGITYEDMTIQFTVGASGLQIAAGYPLVTSSPTIKTARFVAGAYAGPSNVSNYNITVSGPGVASGGETEWSLQASAGANSATTPSSATWYVGSLANNPLAARLKSDGISSTALSYGVSGGASDPNFYPGHLLGFAQTGNAIAIYSFTDSNRGDHSTPISEVTYTLLPK